MNNLENSSKIKSNQNVNNEKNLKTQKMKENNYNILKEKTEENRKKINKSSKKKRKKKKKLLKQIESQISEINSVNLFNKMNNQLSNPYRLFLLYKLRKKYDSKLNIYDIKKVNELIFNIPSHFTAIFKEYLLKEEEAEFLKRIYYKNEIEKKLKNIFYFYEKYSKIFPNYIVIPEGHHLYKNILKKQKMIDKLQKIKEEEMKNKEILLGGSFDTIFSNGAIDSIYNNNKDSFNSNTLASILSLENNNDRNEEEELIKIEYIIKNIEKYEDKNLESLGKKQIIYKKEFKGLRSLSKSTIIPNGKEIKGENERINNKEIEFNYNENQSKKTKKNCIIRGGTKNKKILNSENNKINIESESEKEEENVNLNNIEKINIINKKEIELKNLKNQKNKYKMIISSNKNIEKEKTKINENEIVNRNKKKKFIVLRGNRHYFIKNKEKDEKSLENTYNNYQNEEKKFTLKSQNENQLFFSTIDRKNDNSFSQNKNLSKDCLRRKNQNLILYKKKLCNDTRGLSISKKFTDIENNDKVLHKVSTNYTINGSKIVKIRKYFINEQKSLIIKNKETNELFKNKRNMNEDIYLNYNDKQNVNINYFKTIAYSKSNFDINEQNKTNYSINGNVYYKKYNVDNLRNSYGDKRCPRKFNKFLADIHSEIRKKQYINNNSSIEEKEKIPNNNDDNNNQNHRYYRINQYNNKKFKLKAPKNYYKIDYIENI